MAVNIAEGNGYSATVGAPFDKQFFREPGYPFFFSIACFINKQIGFENIPLEFKDPRPGYYDSSHTEILILRIMQALLASVTLWLFYKTLLFFLEPKIATVFSILLILFLPFSIFVTFPQREILVNFLLMAMGYMFLKSAFLQKAIGYDIVFGLLAASLILCLQAYFYILPVFLISHIVITKNLRKSLISTSIIAFVFVLAIAPWTYRAYLEVKDIRVAKTFGISYTYEFKKYHDANARAYFANIDDNPDEFIKRIVDGYSETGKLMFEKSFNGYYLNYADSLNNVIKTNVQKKNIGGIKNTMKEVLVINYRKALIWPFWKSDYRKNISESINGKDGISMMISIGLATLLGLLALIGIVLYIRKTWFYLPVFVFHFLMIPLLADEGRRVLPFLPFYFMFFLLAAFYLYSFIKGKLASDRNSVNNHSNTHPFLF